MQAVKAATAGWSLGRDGAGGRAGRRQWSITTAHRGNPAADGVFREERGPGGPTDEEGNEAAQAGAISKHADPNRQCRPWWRVPRRAPERMSPAQLDNYRMPTPPAHPMNDGLSLYPQAGAVSLPPQPAGRSEFPHKRSRRSVPRMGPTATQVAPEGEETRPGHNGTTDPVRPQQKAGPASARGISKIAQTPA
jgi:hypothetical protein